MSRNEADRELERLRAATAHLAPGEGLADAVLAAVTEAPGAEDPLAGIARATRALDAAPAFTDAVAARAAAEGAGSAGDRPAGVREGSTRRSRRAPVSWLDGVTRSGPVALGLAVVAAAASFLIFLSSQRDVDVKVASSMDSGEVIE